MKICTSYFHLAFHEEEKTVISSLSSKSDESHRMNSKIVCICIQTKDKWNCTSPKRTANVLVSQVIRWRYARIHWDEFQNRNSCIAILKDDLTGLVVCFRLKNIFLPLFLPFHFALFLDSLLTYFCFLIFLLFHFFTRDWTRRTNSGDRFSSCSFNQYSASRKNVRQSYY